MRVEELIAKLKGLPGDWLIDATRRGSLEYWEPGDGGVGQKYGYLFFDGREDLEFSRKHPRRERFN